MEHRYSSRIAVAGDVGIYRATAGWAAGRLINMSTRGALVAVERNSLCPHTPITLVLGVDRVGEREWQILRAVVVRVGPKGIGVEYLEHDRRCARVLRGVIENGSQSPFVASRATSRRRPTAADRLVDDSEYARAPISPVAMVDLTVTSNSDCASGATPPPSL